MVSRRLVFGGALLLAVGLLGALLLAKWEWTFDFPVDEKVAEDPAGAPIVAVGPSFDARTLLVVYENGPASYEVLAFAIIGAVRYAVEISGKTRLEKDQGIVCSRNITIVAKTNGTSLS